jgi:hypothetical protein
MKIKKVSIKPLVKPFPKKKPQTQAQARTAWLIERRLIS